MLISVFAQSHDSGVTAVYVTAAPLALPPPLVPMSGDGQNDKKKNNSKLQYSSFIVHQNSIETHGIRCTINDE